MQLNLQKTILMLSKYFLYGFIVQLMVINLVFATNVNGQYIPIDKVYVRFQNETVTITDFIKSIEAQTSYNFLYDEKDLKGERAIKLNKKSGTVEEYLKTVSLQSNLRFRQVNNGIDVKLDSSLPPNPIFKKQSDDDVTGQVLDESGLPMPGVTVVVRGTTSGTVTDVDGKFSIDVPEGGFLIFSFIGFEDQVMEVGNQSQLKVILKESLSDLEEVVVVGYGEQQKANLTGAVSTVKFDDELANRPITNASQALGGTASGVWVSQNSGKPGGDGAQIRIRGWGTLNNSNPLIIIDGVEGSFDQINPSDIENITVLKDAASAAIFGSKAANGVVLVTTKMGSKGDKMQVSVNAYGGVQSLGRRYDLINNSAQHMILSNQALTNDGASPLFSQDLISSFENGGDPFKYPNTNWFKELFQNAPIQEYNVSIRGGGPNLSSYLSFNYLNQEGMVPNTNSKRYGIRANVESDVNNWLKVSGRFSYLKRDSEEPYSDVTYGSLGRVFEMLGGAAPYIAPYTSDGRFGSVQAIASDGSLLYDNRNPLIDAANGKSLTDENLLTINTAAEVKFSDFISWKTTFATNVGFSLVDRYNTSVFGYTDTGIETITKNYNREGLEINRSNLLRINNNLFTTLNFKKEIGTQHSFTGVLGIQLESNKVRNTYARRTLPPKEGLTQVDAGTSGIQSQGNMTQLKIFSYFGRVNYSFNQKYLFEANLRADGSSRFKKGNQWGVFPGFSAGWRLGDEQFIQDLNLFSSMKFRASWGRLGNQNISGFWPYLTAIDQNNGVSYNFGGSFFPGAAITTLVDEDITWETTTTLDLGLEMGFWEDQLTLELDYFKRVTNDIIVQLPIPQVLGGLTPPFENLGEMVNDGFEIIANYSNYQFDRNKLDYNVGVNLTYIKNEVTQFAGGKSPDQLYLIREGYSFNTLYGYNAIGIYQSDAEALEHMHSNGFKPKAGNLKFEDVNNDGRLDFEDKQGLGNTIPKFTFGISPGFKYKGFDLNILFQGILGVNVYTLNNFTNLDYENRVISTRWLDAWSPENTDTDVPSAKFDNSWDESPSSYWVDELNYIKLKNIQLGYAMPQSFLTKSKLQKAYVYVNAQNVFSIVGKDYEGYDPERNTFNSGYSVYPVPRIVSLGVNLNF